MGLTPVPPVSSVPSSPSSLSSTADTSAGNTGNTTTTTTTTTTGSNSRPTTGQSTGGDAFSQFITQMMTALNQQASDSLMLVHVPHFGLVVVV